MTTITTAEYSHYPGQELVDHPDEERLLASGDAVPVVTKPETAAARPKPETRKT